MNINVENLSNGDLIWRQMQGNPLFNHYGVFIRFAGEELVIHKQSETGQRITTLHEFLKGYELRGSASGPHSGKTASEIMYHFEGIPQRRFNLFFSNCEKFAHQLSGKRYNSKELDKLVLTVVAVTVIFAVIKN